MSAVQTFVPIVCGVSMGGLSWPQQQTINNSFYGNNINNKWQLQHFSNSDPREIGLQAGERQVTVDQKGSYRINVKRYL